MTLAEWLDAVAERPADWWVVWVIRRLDYLNARLRHLWICLRQGRIRVHYRDEDTTWMVGRKGRVSYVVYLSTRPLRQWSKCSPAVLRQLARSGRVMEWDPRQQMGVGL